MAHSQHGGEFELRDGETALPFDPAERVGDSHVVFIGHIRSPWIKREDCPKNMRQARERQASATVHVDLPYRPGLQGLDANSPIVILSWLERAPRNLIVQKPRHAETAKGVFALRSPVRPNPVGLHVARLTSIDREAGKLVLDAIDVLDGTPIIDIKPYFASTDSFYDGTG